MALVKTALKKGASKLLTTANTGFFGYEIGHHFVSQQQPQTNHTTIIQTTQEKDASNFHFWIVFGFLLLLSFLGTLAFVIRVLMKMKTTVNSVTNGIELQANVNAGAHI